jgi:hypothetical protein
MAIGRIPEPGTGIPESIVDAKGDIITATGSDAPARLAVGANGTTLVADSSEATGLKWATPAAGGGMTLINTGGTTLTGGSVTISSIPATYKNIYIVVRNPRPNANASTNLRFNGDTGSNYQYNTTNINENFNPTGADLLQISWVQYASAASDALITANIYDYANSTSRKVVISGGVENYQGGGSNFNLSRIQPMWNSNAAITSITVLPSGGNTWTSGTVFVYGVS